LNSIASESATTSDISARNFPAQSDEHLLSKARSGNPSAFGELCKRHEKRIFHVALRITRNHEDAEDALQECFLNAMVHLRDFDGRSQFTTWLTRIAINAALMKSGEIAALEKCHCKLPTSLEKSGSASI